MVTGNRDRFICGVKESRIPTNGDKEREGRVVPRFGRVVLPSFPHHVVQRGHNKQAVFAEESDYRYYLRTLQDFKDLYEVKVFGFCLMTNHVHLVLQPGESVSGLGQLMKRLSGRQTRLVNRQEGRSGTLWETAPGKSLSPWSRNCPGIKTTGF